MSKSNFNNVCDNGVLIEPWAEVSIFDFEDAERLIDSGYVATIRAMPQIRQNVSRMADQKVLNEKRALFKREANPDSMIFDNIAIRGVSENAATFIRKSITRRRSTFSMTQLKRQYFRLVADDKIRSAYPTVMKDSASEKYTLNLSVKKDKHLYVDVGGNISNRPISNVFLGLQYNQLGKIGFTAYANGYLGKLNSSGHAHVRFDIPTKVPFYLEPSFTYSRWDYYRSSALFYSFEKPAYLIQEDAYGKLSIGMPLGNLSKVVLSGGYAESTNRYYQTDVFNKLDTNDVTVFDFSFAQLAYQINTLNRKQYASEGTYISARLKYVNGLESYYPGSTAAETENSIHVPAHQWLNFKLTIDKYVRPFKFFRFGVFAEGVYSSQDFFRNYTSSILLAPAFSPIPESQTLFIDDYRAFQYVAGGLKLITTPVRNLDVRFEGYYFQPVLSIIKNTDNTAKYTAPFLYHHFLGMGALVFHSPIGPLSIGVNYYDKNENSFSFFFHLGYTIYNKRSID